MSRYKIEFVPSALRQFKKFPPSVRTQVQIAIDGLAEEPRPHGYKKLHGKLKEFYRIDTGNYRVVYEIHDKVLIVVVVKVGDRRDVYK
jgi:mRNA interferase RelE/StbE